jgi:hypothetical protein
MQRLEAVCRDLENGADIGCRGDARSPTVSSNASSAYDCGAEVTDAVAGWVEDGIAAGPFDPALRPSNAKVNGVMCRIKPNGTARIILNMSAPKGKITLKSWWNWNVYTVLWACLRHVGAFPYTNQSSLV